MKVLVTGATGYVGSHLLPELVARGHEVRALVLPGEDDSPLRAQGVEVVRGDLGNDSSLLSALEGVDLCYHLAGINSFWIPRKRDYYEVNVEGVRRLLFAARKAGVKRVVHTSSAVTIGEKKGETGTEETVHRGYFLSHYERSKFQGEKLALSLAGPDLEVVVVNPTSAFGPARDRGSGKLFLDFLRGRLPGIFGGKINLLFIEDMVKGHLLAAERGRSGQRYILAGENLTVDAALRMAAAVAGISRIPPRWPAALVWARAWAEEARYFLTGRPPSLPRDQVRTLLHGICVDNSKSRQELGMTYTPFREALALTVAGYRQAGLIPPRS
jgi:dihydroflavonol-4-reductase